MEDSNQSQITESQRERVCHVLKIIANIEQNHKLYTKQENGIQLEHSDTKFQCVWRFIYGENRRENLKYIDSIVNEACTIIKKYIDRKCELLSMPAEHKDGHTSTTPNSDSFINFKYSRKTFESIVLIDRQISNMIQDLYKSKTGILNLKSTYSEDADCKAKIELILQKIDDKLHTFNMSIKYINSNETEIQSKK